jgi:hypothetical protein
MVAAERAARSADARWSRLGAAGLGLVGATLAPEMLGVGARASAWCQMVSGNIRPTPSEPCVLAPNHEGIFALAWNRRCTSISVSEALPPRDLSVTEVQDVLRGGISAWTTADCGGAGVTGLSVDVLSETNACSAASHYTNGRNVHSVIFVRDGWADERGHDTRAYAVTFVWHDPSTGIIRDADMEINEARGEYAVCPELGCTDGRIDLPNVLTHELGHYFGLAHTPDDVNATMHASAPPGETMKRTLAADDVTGICTMYPPGALPEACDPAPNGGLDLACAPPSSCGCAAPGAERGGRGPLALLLALALGLGLGRRRGLARAGEDGTRLGSGGPR